MRLSNDDAMFFVDSRFLGPGHSTWPVAIRYVCWLIGAAVFVAWLLGLHYELGARLTPMWGLWIAFATVVVTTAIGNRIDHDRPARTVLGTFWAELGATRPTATRTVTAGLKVRRLR